MLLFQSKILRENWAKEDHDAVTEIVLQQDEKLVGIRTGVIEDGENVGVCFNLQFVILK